MQLQHRTPMLAVAGLRDPDGSWPWIGEGTSEPATVVE